MTATQTIRDPGDLIAAIPTLIGYTPRESLVIVGIGRGGRVVVTLRVDRAALAGDAPDVELGVGVAGALARAEARAAVIIVFTTADVRLACPAADLLVDAIAPGLDHTDVWAAVRGRYFAPGCADACCPPAGTPVSRASAARTASRSVAAADARERTRARRAASRWWARRERDLGEWRRESWRRWEAAVVADTVPDAVELGKMGASLRDVAVRDALIVRALPGGADLAPEVAAGRRSDAIEQALDAVTHPHEAVGPDGADASAVESRARAVTSHLGGAGGAAAWEVIAFVRWWHDDVPRAAHAVIAASDASATCTLAPLVGAALERGLRPGWTYPDDWDEAT